MVLIHFDYIEKSSVNVHQNISFFVPCTEEIHIGLEKHESEEMMTECVFLGELLV